MSSDERLLVELFAALAKVKLDAVVVGSMAAILQGVPVTTQDVDLLTRDTPANRRKLKPLCTELGATQSEIWPLIEGLRLFRSNLQVDILFDRLRPRLGFEGLKSRGITVQLGRESARVARLEDIAAAKRAAGRPKDLLHLHLIEETIRVKKALAQED
jgi:hypothetical protein